MSGKSVGGAAAVEHFVRPRSVAIVGLSTKPGSAGMNLLANLTLNEFAGDIHLVGRSGGAVDGRTVLTEISHLPEGVDLAIFALPETGVKEALEACVRRAVKAVAVLASGFAEVGERSRQDEIARIARDGGIALLGPNCFGYTNFVDGFHAAFVAVAKVPRLKPGRDPCVAILSQSGGVMSHIRQSLELRDIPATYTISTGNEAGLGLAEFVAFLADDPATRLIIAYVEEVRAPQAFLAAARRAREGGKAVMMMHPGRTEAAKQAVRSHTGALAGDHAVMRTMVEHAGIVLADSIDELIDAAEVLARYPTPLPHGPGILTFSGALCAIYHDFCAQIGLPVPPLSAAGEAMLRADLPSFATPRNPLDLTTQPIWKPDLIFTGAKALLDDPEVGSLLCSLPISQPALGVKYLLHLLEAVKDCPKPVIFAPLGDRSLLPQEVVDLAREHRVIVSRSAERSLRALRRIYLHGEALARASNTVPAASAPNLPRLGSGPQPEWLGKQVLSAAGVSIPAGDLARNVDEAVAIAGRIGFPVVMKAQAGRLMHKTEAGAVELAIADDAGVRAAWQRLHASVHRWDASIVLNGMLVEAMSRRGLELVVGARRDPRWGPVLLVGIGGVMIEAIGDVRLMAPDLGLEAIRDELGKLKAAALLKGYRGMPAVDIDAVAAVACALGRIMRDHAEIIEVEINPLVAHPIGDGVTALDALIITADGAQDIDCGA